MEGKARRDLNSGMTSPKAPKRLTEDGNDYAVVRDNTFDMEKFTRPVIERTLVPLMAKPSTLVGVGDVLFNDLSAPDPAQKSWRQRWALPPHRSRRFDRAPSVLASFVI